MRPRESRPRQPLYQVNVETKGGQLLPIGPAMMREACDLFAGSIAEQIKLGREKRWSNPHVVPILHILEN